MRDQRGALGATGEALRALYQRTVEEPVPAEMVATLEQLGRCPDRKVSK